MIREEIILELPENQQTLARITIATLVNLGLLTKEIKFREVDLINGDSNEDPLELANRIKEHRLITQQLEELQNLGTKYGEES